MARPLIVSLSIRPFSNSFLNLPTRSTPSQLYHPPVPEEVRSRGITAPAIPLERYKTVAFSKKNKICAASLSGTSFRVVWLLYSLAPEVSSRFADFSNAVVANRT